MKKTNIIDFFFHVLFMSIGLIIFTWGWDIDIHKIGMVKYICSWVGGYIFIRLGMVFTRKEKE